MSGCLRNDVFARSQVTVFKGEPGRPLLWEDSQGKKTRRERKNPVLVIEKACFCNFTLYPPAFRHYHGKRTWGKIRFCAIQMLFLGEERKATECLLPGGPQEKSWG